MSGEEQLPCNQQVWHPSLWAVLSDWDKERSDIQTDIFSHSLPQAIHKELLCDIMLTVGVLKSKVELVLRVEHFKTRVTAPGTFETATFTVYIHTYILGQLLGILKSSIPKAYQSLFGCGNNGES